MPSRERQGGSKGNGLPDIRDNGLVGQPSSSLSVLQGRGTFRLAQWKTGCSQEGGVRVGCSSKGQHAAEKWNRNTWFL